MDPEPRAGVDLTLTSVGSPWRILGREGNDPVLLRELAALWTGPTVAGQEWTGRTDQRDVWLSRWETKAEWATGGGEQ